MKRPPSQIIGIVRASGRAVALALIETYRAIVSPILAAAIGPACRFEPTCSEYAHDAIGRHGILRGGWMTVKRLARCRPGGGWGYDPAPPGGARCRT